MENSKNKQSSSSKKTNNPKIFLILESASILIASIIIFLYLKGNILFYLLLILAPDIFMIGYMKDSKIGSLIYNLGHFYLLPIILTLFGLLFNTVLLQQMSLIWIGHISLDRALGYGLKYPTNFKDTHLQHL